MKRLLALLALPVLICGCAVAGLSATSGKEGLFNYQGAWVGRDYTLAEFGGDEYPEGTQMELMVNDDGKSGTIKLTYTTIPPVVRVASIESQWRVEGDKAVFELNEDGWAAKGKGWIRLEGDRVIVEIAVMCPGIENGYSFDGKHTFIRKRAPGPLQRWIKRVRLFQRFRKFLDRRRDLEGYQGDWLGDDFRMAQYEGDEFPAGCRLTLGVSEDGKSGDIRVSCIQEPGAVRTAVVESKWYMVNESMASFTFDDDGWGSTGQGAVLFMGDEIIVDITIEHTENSDWSIYEGRQVFRREKP